MLESFYFNPLIGNNSNELWASTENINICGNDCLYLYGSLYNHTIIYSHGNKGNIYTRRDILMDLRYQTKCNVLAYDPPGYGNTPGSPSLLLWAESLTNIINKISGNIILYGESLGGCINALVYEKFKSKIILIVHQESLYSIKDTFEYRFPCLKCISNFIPNINVGKIYKKLESPIIIIHSEEDNKVPYQGAVDLYNSIEYSKYFIKSRLKHCDFPFEIRDKVFNLIYRIITNNVEEQLDY